MIIRLLAWPEKSIEDTRESLIAEIKQLKSSQAEIKNTITEMQTQMDAIKTRMDKSEDQISDTEDKIMGNNEVEKKKKRKVIDHLIADLGKSATY